MARKVILQLCKIADMCITTPFDDGMNLLAKEYVAANDGHGALILSSLAGAALELTDSFLVNPYDVEGMADTIKRVIETDEEEKRKRMRKMKNILKEYNLQRWTINFLTELARLNVHREVDTFKIDTGEQIKKKEEEQKVLA